jgi:hypothetical protein
MQLIKRLFLLLKLSKEMRDMATIYATLIIKGYKTYDEVPATIQPQVAEVLTQLEAEHLITE